MPVRVTIELSEPLYAQLRRHAELTGKSMRSLILRAIEQSYCEPRKGRSVTGPLVNGKGKRGPRYPADENPHDLVFG